VFGTEANSALEVGLIGCGGRGNWIGAIFPEFAGARIVALADGTPADGALQGSRRDAGVPVRDG